MCNLRTPFCSTISNKVDNSACLDLRVGYHVLRIKSKNNKVRWSIGLMKIILKVLRLIVPFISTLILIVSSLLLKVRGVRL